MADETCRAYEVDGEQVRVHGGAPLSEEGEAALAEVVRAAKRLMAEEHPHAGVIQELVAAARAAGWCIPDGIVASRGRHELVDGFEVRTRLKAAVQAAREALDAKPPLKAPAESVHPGEILREELKARGLTQLACAELMGRSVRVVNRIVKGRQSIVAGTALDLEKALGVSAGFWVRLQADHDVWVARQRRGGES